MILVATPSRGPGCLADFFQAFAVKNCRKAAYWVETNAMVWLMKTNLKHFKTFRDCLKIAYPKIPSIAIFRMKKKHLMEIDPPFSHTAESNYLQYSELEMYDVAVVLALMFLRSPPDSTRLHVNSTKWQNLRPSLTYNSLSEEQVITHKFKCPAWKPAGFTHTHTGFIFFGYLLT